MHEPLQKNYQLKLSSQEMSRLEQRVIQDYRSAIGDHSKRVQRCVEYYRAWRSMPDQPGIDDAQKSNYRVPLIKWNVLAKLAKEIDNLFGDDAEIVAVPTGESDARKVKKIGKYMSWRVFSSMKLLTPFIVFTLRKLLYGRSIAYAPWRRDTFTVAGKELVDYDGPGFEPLLPDDFIVPVEDVQTLHQFSFVIRRYRVTPQLLLEGERTGLYQGIKANFAKIVMTSKNGFRRDWEGEQIAAEADQADSLPSSNPLSTGESLTVIEWHGKWRMLKSKNKDAGEEDIEGREYDQSDIVVRVLKDIPNMVVSVQDLRELYPTMKNPRPFVESAMLSDGRYWAPGLPEMLLDAEDELSVNHNVATTAGQFSIGPVIVVRRASGTELDKTKVEPNMIIEVDNPATDVRMLEFKTDTQFASWKEQAILAFIERVTGLSDLALGRQSDRPNAPRTAFQTGKLLDEGNVRITLDTKILREDMARILTHFWELEYCFTPEQMFFRVTEEDADGLFPTKGGGATITSEDRDGRYDFDIKFATSAESKEVKKQQTIQRYGIDLQNPLIVNNPSALWEVTRQVHEALGDANFAAMVAKPPEQDIPVDPKQEWARIQEGEEVNPHPMDNDELHLVRHRRDIAASETDPNADKDAVQKLSIHYMQHIEQLQQKKIVQALADQAMTAIQQLAPSPMPGMGGPGVPQSAVPQSPQAGAPPQ